MFTICEGEAFCATEQREEQSVRQGVRGRTVASCDHRLLKQPSNIYCASITDSSFLLWLHGVHGDLVVNNTCIFVVVAFPVLCNVDLYSGIRSKKINFY